MLELLKTKQTNKKNKQTNKPEFKSWFCFFLTFDQEVSHSLLGAISGFKIIGLLLILNEITLLK